VSSTSIQRKRAERIRGEVSISQVLYDYGYRIDPGNTGQQQFSCDLHGTGIDRKPSARVYPESNTWHCWGCGKTRDAIETVKEKEKISFLEACKILEKRSGLPDIDWGADPSYEESSPETSFSLSPSFTFEDHQKRCQKVLDLETEDKDLPMKVILSLWSAFDQISYGVELKEISIGKGKELLEKIRNKVIELRKKNVGN